VAPVLIAYAAGMFFYLGRDVLVRVFYALGDGETPFRISIFNIFLNGCLDFLLYKPFGTSGLVFATIGVNIISMGIFLWLLNRRLGGLNLPDWGLSLFKLTTISFLAGLAAWGFSLLWQQFSVNDNLLLQLLQLGTATAIALGVFAVLAAGLKIPETEIFLSRIRQKFCKKKA
jgi:putative peptidoglycan lipid II flippase